MGDFSMGTDYSNVQISAKDQKEYQQVVGYSGVAGQVAGTCVGGFFGEPKAGGIVGKAGCEDAAGYFYKAYAKDGAGGVIGAFLDPGTPMKAMGTASPMGKELKGMMGGIGGGGGGGLPGLGGDNPLAMLGGNGGGFFGIG